MLMPRALSAISDAKNALARLTLVFDAEIITQEPFGIDPGQAPALEVVDASWQWEEVLAVKEKKAKAVKGKAKAQEVAAIAGNRPFQVRDVNMSVPRGHLAAIVGPVGSGKSSLLQGLIGEMRKLKGSVTFGGRVGYCPQSAWIQNASLVSVAPAVLCVTYDSLPLDSLPL